MNILEKRKLLKNKIFSLQDEVSKILSIDNDVDKFLDNSTVLERLSYLKTYQHHYQYLKFLKPHLAMKIFYFLKVYVFLKYSFYSEYSLFIYIVYLPFSNMRISIAFIYPGVYKRYADAHVAERQIDDVDEKAILGVK